jgi:hypothetical protein
MFNCHEDLLTPPTAMPKINHAMRHGYVLNVNEEMFSTLVVTVTVPHTFTAGLVACSTAHSRQTARQINDNGETQRPHLRKTSAAQQTNCSSIEGINLKSYENWRWYTRRDQIDRTRLDEELCPLRKVLVLRPDRPRASCKNNETTSTSAYRPVINAIVASTSFD